MRTVRKRTPAEPSADRATDRIAVMAHRAQRMAAVVAGTLRAPHDFHSLDAFCGATSVGVSARTFRRWCHDENLSALDVVRLARILRAATMAAENAERAAEFCQQFPSGQRAGEPVASSGRARVTEHFDSCGHGVFASTAADASPSQLKLAVCVSLRRPVRC